jgi:isopentenyl phosphate kinase
MKNLIFLKIGGSLITKRKPYTLNRKRIRELTKEIAKLRKKHKFKLLIGNGAGSFAHVSAKKFRTKEGYINEKSKIGHCIVQDDASRLNRILVRELIKAGENAISVQPSAFIFCSKRKIKSFFLDPIKNYLKNDLVPIVFGDVISDEKFGCTILSTEEIFKLLAKFLKPKKIILISDVEGVYDSRGKVISEINKENFSKIQKFLRGANKIDVTGGMVHKVKEAMEMAKGKIEVFIIGGKKGNLERCLKREKVGTRIIFK